MYNSLNKQNRVEKFVFVSTCYTRRLMTWVKRQSRVSAATELVWQLGWSLAAIHRHGWVRANRQKHCFILSSTSRRPSVPSLPKLLMFLHPNNFNSSTSGDYSVWMRVQIVSNTKQPLVPSELTVTQPRAVGTSAGLGDATRTVMNVTSWKTRTRQVYEIPKLRLIIV